MNLKNGLRAALTTLSARSVLLMAVAVLAFTVRAIAQGIQSSPQQAPSIPFLTTTTQDPWFWVMVGAWLLSSLVSGMPEPEKTDSPFYIWMYRSLHLIVASGTSYFQHKKFWPDPVGIDRSEDKN